MEISGISLSTGVFRPNGGAAPDHNCRRKKQQGTFTRFPRFFHNLFPYRSPIDFRSYLLCVKKSVLANRLKMMYCKNNIL